MEKKLYSWQEECLERWFANHGRGMVQAVTGSGKTLLALTAAKRLEERLGQELKVKIVVPTGALMKQWHGALREFLAKSCSREDFCGRIGQEIGLRGGGHRDSPDRKYVIYVINSARYELARQILAELRAGERVLLIADECHRYGSGQNRLIFEFLPHVKREERRFFSLGLSATLPFGRDQRDLASVLGKEIYRYDVEKASVCRTVCQYDVYHIQLSFQKEERDQYEELSDRMAFLYGKLVKFHPSLKKRSLKERFELLRGLSKDKNWEIAEAASLYMNLSYKRKNLVCLAASRIPCVCDLVERLDPGEKILIFGERIRQAEELYKILEGRYPEKVGRYHSQMGDQANANALKRFRRGETRILIACKAMDEGVDIPDVSVGIILSGTSAQRQRVQRLGRIIRKKEGKDRAFLYYLHIEETSEDACFLPDAGERHVFELEYLSPPGKFSHPVYDAAADDLLGGLEEGGTVKEKIEEVRRCLRLGQVRSDWVRGRDDLDGKIAQAKYTRDKNYWICMKKLRQLTGG